MIQAQIQAWIHGSIQASPSNPTGQQQQLYIVTVKSLEIIYRNVIVQYISLALALAWVSR